MGEPKGNYFHTPFCDTVPLKKVRKYFSFLGETKFEIGSTGKHILKINAVELQLSG